MTLPLLVSLPHAGLRVPEEVADVCILTPREIAHDGDEGAAEIYDLRDEVANFVTTDIARAVVDLNRTEDDLRPDGVVKTHTCWGEPVYRAPLSKELVEALLSRYHRPYHRRLSELAGSGVILGVDCHTMAVQAPPVGPDPGRERPGVCLSHAGHSCPDAWLELLARCFAAAFEGFDVRLNDPFHGGHIVRTHATELPWVQLELSRAAFLSTTAKRARVLRALREFCEEVA